MNKLLVSILSVLALLALSGSASAVGNVNFDFPDEASIGDEVLVNITSDITLDPGCRYNITFSAPTAFDVSDISMKYKALNGTWRESEWPSEGPYVSGGSWSVQIPDGDDDSVSGINLSDNMSAMANFTINNGAPVGQYSISIELLNMTTDTVNATGSDTMTVNGVEIEETGEGYSTIQYAIDNASAYNTVNVAPGTYDEYVDVDKSLTLIGQSGAIIAPSSSSSNDQIIEIASDNVTVQGLEVDGSNTSEANWAGIGTWNGRTNVTIKDNIVHDINNSNNQGLGIGFWRGDSTGFGNIRIEGNTVYNTHRMGIYVGGSDGADSATWYLSTVTIMNNIVHDTMLNPNSDETYPGGCGGITVDAANNTLIEGNTVYDIANEMPGIFLAHGSGSGNEILENEVYGQAYGIGVEINRSDVDFGSDTATAPEVHWNSIHDNTKYGLDAFSVDGNTVNATLNWWGSENGPTHSSNTLSNTGDNVSDNVNFTPWLDAPDGEPTAPVQVNGDYFINLQDAINAASPGATIKAGSFVFEPVEVNKNVTLTAASTPVIDCYGSSQNNGINITSDYVTIDQFEILNCTIGVNSSDTSFTNVTNCKIHSNTQGVYIGAGSNNVVNYNDIYNNNDGVENGNANAQLDARYNWWGDPSGPSGDGKGTGDSINGNISYTPWLGTEDQNVYFVGYNSTSGIATDNSLDATEDTDTNVTVDDKGPVTISIGKYSGNPVKDVYYDKNITSIEKYVDVFTNESANITIKLYYTEADITGKDNSTFEMYYWNETGFKSGKWEKCNYTGESVSTADDGYLGYVYATINDTSNLEPSDLEGTVFSAGGQPLKTTPPTVGGTVAPVDKIVVAAPYIISTLMCLFCGVGVIVATRR